MAETANFIILGCWIIFVSYWIISATRTKKIVERQSVASALAHRIPVALGWWTLVFPRLPGPLNRFVIPQTGLALAAGSAVCVFGLGITLWARWTLAGNWSSDVTFKQAHALVRTGPYRFVRHPIYTGLLAMYLGSAIEMGRLRCWVGFVLVVLGFWIKVAQEERLLRRHFPEAYATYQREVKALVPWIL